MKTSATGKLQLWVFVRSGEVRSWAVLCGQHALELLEYVDSLRMDPPVSLVRVRRADLLAALADDERHGRTGCVACGRAETLRVTIYPDAPRPSVADVVGQGAKA
jgi:hypothetical protein